MPGTDIILIKPGGQRRIYGVLSDFDLTALEPPLWAALMAGYLRGAGYAVEILDAEAGGLTEEKTAQAVSELSPLLAVVMVSGSNPSASTASMPASGKIAREIKRGSPRIKTAMAGLHPTALPRHTMETETIDYLIRGEGFFTLPKLIDALRAGAEPLGVPGLWYRKDGRIMEAARPRLLENLDSLPRPAWDMLPMKSYRAHNWHCFDDITKRKPYAVLHTSLGCPFDCRFCCTNALFGKRGIRYRSRDSVIAELECLVKTHNVRNIKLMDEMFALNERRVIDLCEAIIERGFDLNIWAYARVDTITEPMLEKMKRAGINWLAYGIESGNCRVRSASDKDFGEKKMFKTLRMTRDQGIHVCSNFIFGLPGEDYKSMNDTLALMLELNTAWANIYCAMAYPGSRLYDDAVKKNIPLPDNWSAYSQYSPDSRPLATGRLTGGQVLAFRDYAFDVYYKNPGYLNMIRNTFGKPVMEHVRQMTNTRLKRNYSEI